MVAAASEEAAGGGGGHGVQGGPDGGDQGVEGARRGGAQVRLELGEGLLDGVEVGRVGRQQKQPAAENRYSSYSNLWNKCHSN